MNKSKKAVECFNNNFNCCQAILATYGPEFGLSEETALKLATGFGAGISYTGNTCGAVTGALMVIGLKHGKVKAGDDTAKEKTNYLCNKFISEFEEKNGSVICNKLLNIDISNRDELEMAKEKMLFTTLCPKLVDSSGKILEKILKNENK